MKKTKKKLSYEQLQIMRVRKKYDNKVHKIRKKSYEKHLAKKYFKQNTKKFYWLKIIMIIGIVSNMSALLITNAIVVKNEPTTQIFEVNPGACGEDTEIQCHPATNNKDQPTKNFMIYFVFIFWILLRPAILATVMIYMYYSIKRTSYNDKHFYLNSSVILFFALSLAYDMINDLGWWLGKILWG